MPLTGIIYKNILTPIFKYWPCLLLLLAFIGFVSKAFYNYPVGVMAILGLYRIAKNPKVLRQDPVLKTFGLVFLCLWLPLLMAFVDAVNPSRSIITTLGYLRFFFAGIFIIQEIVKDPIRLEFTTTALFCLIFFWCVDATIQFAYGKNLLGFPYEAEHISGMFYPRPTIAHTCAVLSPFCFLYLYDHFENKKWILVSLLPLFFVVLLSGRRAAWLMLFLSSLCFLGYGFLYSKRKIDFSIITATAAVILTFLLFGTIIFHDPTNDRYKKTLKFFSNNYASVDLSTSHRLFIWKTALIVFKSNPVNGIGARGFRYIYEDYAAPDDFFVVHNSIPTHPHIVVLEILTETGIVGLIAYLIALLLMVKMIFLCGDKKALIPFFIPVAVAIFPLNAHQAFYGSIWSSMVWLLIAVYFAKAGLLTQTHPPAQVDSDH